jgi:hypothetical protein
MPEQLLSSLQMARFVADGYLTFPGVVPEEINRDALAEMGTDVLADRGYRGERFHDRYRGLAMHRVFQHPPVAGIIASLVGADPIFDLHALHVLPPHCGASNWHQDAVIDPKPHFDLQLLYFPHHTPREMGGTMLLPGSHFRRTNVWEVGRYQNFVDQVQDEYPAGSVVALHHGIWHCSQANRTDRQRLMFKIRLAASEPQRQLFDTRDIADPQVARILSREHQWAGSDSRLEIIHRARLWRLLTGDPDVDIDYYLGRLENCPQREVPRAARLWRQPEVSR